MSIIKIYFSKKHMIAISYFNKAMSREWDVKIFRHLHFTLDDVKKSEKLNCVL